MIWTSYDTLELQSWSPKEHQRRYSASSRALYDPYVPISDILAIASTSHLYLVCTRMHDTFQQSKVEARSKTDFVHALTLGDLDRSSRSPHFAGSHRAEICGC